jgi:plastocyanin
MRIPLRALCALAIVLCTLITGAGAAQPEALKPAVDPDGVVRVSVIAGSYFFKPNHIVVKVRTPVELTIVKEPGIAPHNFVMQAPDAGITVNKELSTEPTRITFTPTAPGRFPFYCTNKLLFFPSHRHEGMEGVLEVVE